jgi:hypothetical protein
LRLSAWREIIFDEESNNAFCYFVFLTSLVAQTKEIIYLSGTDNKNTVALELHLFDGSLF